ncbi:hypothetical protein GGS20DRAFT_585313 [Poronia punctata]|nr:hypothetical protein GGS20DRAFT_585313 [Poronia punctata]
MTFFLPGGNDVYVTHTREGRPALARGKSEILRKDFGFDILGQTFGIPSRRAYEQQERRPSIRRNSSIKSQSTGVITAPTTPRRGRSRNRADENNLETLEKEIDLPAACCKPGSIWSCSTPVPPALRKGVRDGSSVPCQNPVARGSHPPFPQPRTFVPPPPPPPPPPAFVGWQNHGVLYGNGTSLPTSYPNTAPGTAHTPANPPPFASSTGVPAGIQQWGHPLHQGPPQYSNRPVAVPIQPVPNTHLFNNPAHPYPSIPFNIPPTHGGDTCNIPPPPPPPPPQVWPKAQPMVTGHVIPIPNGTDQARGPHREAREVERSEHRKPTLRKSDADVDMEDIGKRIRHVHICAGCGRKRSRGYQRDNPLKRGEIPVIAYCHSCVHQAGGNDSEVSQSKVAGDARLSKHRTRRAASSRNTDEGRKIASGKYIYKEARHSPRMVQRRSRFGFLSKLFSRQARPSRGFQYASSDSSGEILRSSISSSATDPSIAASSLRLPTRTTRRRTRRISTGSSNVQVGGGACIQPRERVGHTYTYEGKRQSLVPGEAVGRDIRGKTNNPTSHKAQGISQPRSRIPRPRPIPPPIDVGIRNHAYVEAPASEELSTPPRSPDTYVTETLGTPSTLKKSKTPTIPITPSALNPSKSPSTPEAPEAPEATEAPEAPAGTRVMASSCSMHVECQTSSELSDLAGPMAGPESSEGSKQRRTKDQGPVPARHDPIAIPEGSEGSHRMKPRRKRVSRMSVAEKSTNAWEEGPARPEARSETGVYTREAQSPPKRNQESGTGIYAEEPHPSPRRKYEFNPEGPPPSRPFTQPKNSGWWSPHRTAPHGSTNRRTSPIRDEPPTPPDVPYVGFGHAPYVFVSDSWSGYQSEMEREVEELVEELAERDLAAAGKLFDSFSHTMGGSMTSTFPLPSFLTTSTMSIVSYDSDSESQSGEPSGPAVAARQIEFSSESERRSKLGTSRTPDAAFEGTKSDSCDNESTYCPSPVGSSMVGHTGHSTDDFVRSRNAHES